MHTRTIAALTRHPVAHAAAMKTTTAFTRVWCSPPVQFYTVSFSEDAQRALPNLYATCTGQYNAEASGIATAIRSLAGVEFTVFAKSTAWVRCERCC